MRILWLFLLPCVLGVKIGVSKINATTTTTTTAPNVITTTTKKPALEEDFTETQTTTTISITTTADLEFPPKITKSSRKNSTLKPTVPTTTITTTTTELTTTVSTAVNFENFENVSNPNGPSNYYCTCNLMPLSCDTNCCCDADCSKDALKVFNCFLPSKYPELRVRLEDFQYEHGLPSCKINDGWLCVFRTNTHPPAAKVIPHNFEVANRFKWSSSLAEIADVEQRPVRDFYKYGDPIYLIDENNLEIKNFELPYAFKPPYCKLKEPIRHLLPVERLCLVSSLAAAQNVQQEIEALPATYKLLSRPKAQISVGEDLADHVLPFQVKTLLQKLEHKFDDSMDINNLSNETEIEDLPQSFLKEVNIKFMHNFTDLLHCLIEVKLQEIAENESQVFKELWQKYSVEFIAINDTTAIEQPLNVKNTTNQFGYSGPLGYLMGEPLIIAKFVANNESEELSSQNRILDYFKMPLAQQNTLRVLARVNGLCQRRYGKVFSLNFGISSLHQCNFQMPSDSFAKPIKTMKNATEICTILQQQILIQLFESTNFEELTEIFVSTLGHPQNVTEKWLPLQIRNLDFAPVAGQLIDETQLIVCRNILLSAAYEFHIGTFTEQGFAHQSLIKQAVLNLGQRNDLEFTLDEQLEVPLTLTVMFYDLSFNIGSSNFHKSYAWLSFMILIAYQELL